ncbi:MAG: sulfotransferase family protein [Caulobacteraceae bacterium]
MVLEIVGAGLGRTGTMSLKLALQQLGFGPCHHMFEVIRDADRLIPLWQAAGDGKPDWEATFEGFRSTVDWPSATYWRELAAYYPTAKVILSLRDSEAWWRSTQSTIFAPREDPPGPFRRMVDSTVGVMFDQKLNDRDLAISVFERHNASVKAAIPAERLLIYDLAEGWDPLCRFLAVPVPDTPMPKVNTTEEFRSRVRQAVESQAS